MKKITLTIRDDKVPFFMDLIKNFKFVQVKNEEDSKKNTIVNIKKGLRDLQLFKQGKLETISEEAFMKELNEL